MVVHAMDIDKSGEMRFFLASTRICEEPSKDTYDSLLGQEGCNHIENFGVSDFLP